MGNIISLDTIGERISMSNGLTSVFIDVLGLSGTHLAKTAAEKRMISDMDLRMFHQEAARKWLHDTMDVPDDPIVCGYPRCPKHPVLLTVFGCHICNN